MGIFKGSKSKRKGYEFKLDETGIEGRAYGLSSSDMVEALKSFAEIGGDLADLQKGAQAINSGDIVKAMNIMPNMVAALLVKASGEDAEDPDEIKGVLDLPAPDLQQLFNAAVDATFKGKTPQDFFAGFAAKLGIDGISMASKPQILPGLPGSTASEIPFQMEAREVSAEEALDIRGH